MNIRISYVGTMNRAQIVWPEGWPVPRQGDSFNVEALGLDEVTTVRHVVWYPHGDEEGPEPYVYVVVGPA